MGRKTKVALTVGAAGVAAWAASKVVAKAIPREAKEALQIQKPVILAHNGGSLDAPENTMIAFQRALENGVDGFVVPVRLTKDEEIVVFQDETLNRTTNMTGNVNDYTWSELQKADAGFHFTEDEELFPFRGEQHQIITLRQLLTSFPTQLIVIALQDSPDTYEGSLMPSKLWRLLEELQVMDRVIVSSTFHEQTDRFNLYAQHQVAIGAGNDEIKKAYASFSSKLGHLYRPKADFFQMPAKLWLFPLTTESFVKFLTKLNIFVCFEEINDRTSLQKALQANADGVITSAPSVINNKSAKQSVNNSSLDVDQ